MSPDDAAGARSDPAGFPAFVSEVAGTLAVHSQYVLHGNLRDQFPVSRSGRPPRPTSLLPPAVAGAGTARIPVLHRARVTPGARR